MLLAVASLEDVGNVDIALTSDDGFGIVVQFSLCGFDVLFDMRHRLRLDIQDRQHFVIAFEDLDCIPALFFLRQIMQFSFFDMSDRVFDRPRECVHRNRLRLMRCFNCGLSGFHQPLALERRDLDHFAAQLARQFGKIDLVAIFAHDVHHVDGNHHRNAQLGQLCRQVKIALQVRTVDDIEDSIRRFIQQILTRDNLFQCIWRERVNARQVRYNDVIMLLELAFLLFYRDTRPVSNKLVGASQRIEQRCLAAVRIARQRNFNYFVFHKCFLKFPIELERSDYFFGSTSSISTSARRRLNS